jgi:PhnB protein
MKEHNSEHATLAQPIPKGFHSITPFLVVKDAEKWLDFVEDAFDGETTFLLKHESGKDAGKVMHATTKIGDSCIMLAEAMDKFPASTAMLYLYVEDVDAVYKQALEAGAESMREPVNEFYGDRSAGVKDKWGNQWWIATHIEDVEGEELDKRAREFNQKNPG